MAQINLTQAAKLTGKNRTTIWRHIKSGKLSASKDFDDNPVVDTSELMRVYGGFAIPLQHLETEEKQQQTTPLMQHPVDEDIAIQIARAITEAQKPLLDKISLLADKVENLTNRLEYKSNDIDNNVRTLNSPLREIEASPPSIDDYLNDIPTFGSH
jgi:uncharacterized protein (UPF0276 family)